MIPPSYMPTLNNHIDYIGSFDYSPGTTYVGKLIVVDSNRDSININNLSASQLARILRTAAEPNITSPRTLLSTLNISGSTPIICNISLSRSTCSLSVDYESGD